MVRESKMTPPTIIYVRIYADPKAGMSNSIFYTGITRNMKLRQEGHNFGNTKTTNSSTRIK